MFVSSLHDKTEYIIQMRNLKQALNHELMLKKVHKLIRFNQKVWLKPYIDINTDLRKASKRDFQKYLLSWWIIRYSKQALNHKLMMKMVHRVLNFINRHG